MDFSDFSDCSGVRERFPLPRVGGDSAALLLPLLMLPGARRRR